MYFTVNLGGTVLNLVTIRPYTTTRAFNQTCVQNSHASVN